MYLRVPVAARSLASRDRSAAPCRQPAFAQRPRQRELLGGRAGVLRPGRLEHERQALEARLGEEHRAAVLAQLALADVRVAVDVGAERLLGVVEVQRAQAL